MHRPWLLTLACWPLTLQALDLTPAHGFRELEGFRISVVRFMDGARTVMYQPPTDWRVSGGGESLQLFPPDRNEAAVRFRVGSRPVTTDGGAAPPEDFERWSRAQLPAEAAEVERVGECAGQFTLGVQSSRALTFSYSLTGRRFMASVAAVDLNDKERLAVVVTARQPDFKAVHDEAIASLFSWQWNDE